MRLRILEKKLTPMPTQSETTPNMGSPSRDESSPGSIKPELAGKVADLLHAIPETERAGIIASLQDEMEIVVHETHMRQYSDLLPHPDVLREIEEVIPGSAEKVVNMALEQSEHRRYLEKHVIDSQITQSNRGQWLGFSIALVGISGSVFLISSGHDVAGSVLGGIDLVALVSIFVLGKVFQRKEMNDKQDG